MLIIQVKTQTWDKRLVAKCLRCDHLVEDNDHILRCQADEALEVWKLSVDKVQAWMDSNHTCPDLAKLVINILLILNQDMQLFSMMKLPLMEWGKSLMLNVE